MRKISYNSLDLFYFYKMLKEFNLNFHSSHIKEIFRVLMLIFNEGMPADKAIEKIMRANKRWGVKERSFVSEHIYDILRHWRLLNNIAGEEETVSEKSLWRVFGILLLLKEFELPESGNFNSIKPDQVSSKFEKFQRVRAIRESVPDWLDKLGEKELGKNWDKIIHALNQRPTVVLRANSLKTNPRELQTKLEEERIATALIPWSPEALELDFTRNVFRTESFREGLFEVQDGASQMVAHFLDVKPGMRVVDACAGAGGKTLHIAALMKNKGRIIALDNKEWKLQELRKRASRAGVNITEIRLIDSSKVYKRLRDTADRLLLDLPCSGLGVLRRNPDTKWKLQPDELQRVIQVQRELLAQYCSITKVGGKMLYCTCSILPSEGEEQIKHFLMEHSDSWKLLEEKRYSPEINNCDGFYMGLLERIK